MNASLPTASPTDSPLPAPLPPAAPTLKARGTATTAAMACMILTVVSCFIPVFGYFFAGIFGAVALILIIVSMAQGDRRGLPLLIIHIIGTPLACFATIVSCGAILGRLGTGAGTAAAIPKPTPLLASAVIAKPTPLLASTPQPTMAAASIPKPTAVVASIPALEMFPSKSVVSAITSNQWSGDALIVLGTLKNTNAVPVRIEKLSAAGFDKDQKSVIEGSDYTIVHNDLAAGETVNFQVSLKDGTKQIRFVKLTPEVAKQ
jgi:cell division septation protein DedD